MLWRVLLQTNIHLGAAPTASGKCVVNTSRTEAFVAVRNAASSRQWSAVRGEAAGVKLLSRWLPVNAVNEVHQPNSAKLHSTASGVEWVFTHPHTLPCLYASRCDGRPQQEQCCIASFRKLFCCICEHFASPALQLLLQLFGIHYGVPSANAEQFRLVSVAVKFV